MDQAQLTQLYESYGYAVHRRCLRFLGSEAEADDALQEVFLRVVRYGRRFQADNPLGWLYRIADNHCIDRIKGRKKLVPDDQLDTSHAKYTKFDEFMEKGFSGYLVRQLLSRADPKDARIAILYHVDGLTQDEVAGEMNCSRKTVKKRLKRFRIAAESLLNRTDRANR